VRLEPINERISQLLAIKLSLSKRSGVSTHLDEYISIISQELESVGKGGRIISRDGQTTPILADHLGEPTRIVVHHRKATGDIVKELVG